jgi:hypothetical protein
MSILKSATDQMKPTSDGLLSMGLTVFRCCYIFFTSSSTVKDKSKMFHISGVGNRDFPDAHIIPLVHMA